MLDASPIAFSGVRVMVNMNQAGEAGGVTAYLALEQNESIPDIPYQDVRRELVNGGSIII